LHTVDTRLRWRQCQSQTDENECPRVHVDGGLAPVAFLSADALLAPGAWEVGEVVYIRDGWDYSRQDMGHRFARIWRAARARYETIYAPFRHELGIAPRDRRFYGIL
jgi:hypothetical protein